MTDREDRATSGDVLAGLLGIWTAAELDQALPERQRGEKARWPMLGIFLLLWQWAFENRVRPFERALPVLWPTTRAIVCLYNQTMAPNPVSPVALFKGRQALGCEPLQALWKTANTKALSRFDALSRTLGLRVYAVDGSWLNLPHAQALVDEFGRPSAARGRTPMPQLLLVTMDLVNLGWFTDLRLGRCNHSELALAREMTDSLGKGDLVLGDRLFFQTLWIAALVRRGVEALFRAAKNRITSLTAESIVAVQRQRSCGGIVDCEVELKVATDHHGKPTSLLPLRYIEITINGETYCFLTTLSKDRISAQAVAELYLARWGIETDYRLFKGPNHLPVIISRTPMTVRQEILLRILTHNSVRFVQAEACLLPNDRQPVPADVLPAGNEPPPECPERQAEPGNGDAAGAALELPLCGSAGAEKSAANQPAETPPATGPVDSGEPAPAPPLATTSRWHPRHSGTNRPLLPVDLRFGMATAHILAATIHAVVEPQVSLASIRHSMLRRIRREVIYAKPGCSYPRLRRNEQRDRKCSKEDCKAQFERRKAHRRLAKLNHTDG